MGIYVVLSPIENIVELWKQPLSNAELLPVANLNWKLKLVMATFSHWQHYRHVILVGTLPARDFIHAEQIEHVKHSDDLNAPHGQLGCFAIGSVLDARHRISIVKPVRVRL